MDKNINQEEEDGQRDTSPSDEITIPSASEAARPRSSNSHNITDGSWGLSDTASSPVGSQTSRSTSSRRSEQRNVVELIQTTNENNDNRNGAENWVIGEGFYHEDFAADDESDLSDDDVDDHNRHPFYRHMVGLDVLTSGSSGEEDDDIDEYDDDDEDVIIVEGDDDANDNDIAILGFEFAPNDRERFRELSSDEEGDANEAVAIQYDISIPNQHRYLGENLEESRGRRVLIENSVVKIPLFNTERIVLLPGQVLPFATSSLNPRIQMYLLSCITRGDCLVGLWSGSINCDIGTTAEIRNYTRSSEEITNVIFEGRQRFKLISPPFVTAIEGIVKILPEIHLGHPFQSIPSWRRFHSSRGQLRSRYIVSKHPKHLLKQYDVNTIVRAIVRHISNWCERAPLGDPSTFSYWVATNLPINNVKRLELLGSNCLETRLLWLLRLVDGKNQYLGCQQCRNVICNRNDVFLMSSSGPQNSFVNAHGHVHDTLTVKQAEGLLYQNEEWSTACTWFPGYAWKIAHCSCCSRHVGWCYKSTEPDYKPKRFWGLTRASVQLQSVEDGNSPLSMDTNVT